MRKAGLGNLFRFRVKTGEMREIIILDASINNGVGFYEHNLQIDGRWGHFEPCVKEMDNCPLCEKYGESTYVVMLSCLDISGYTKKGDGGQPGEFIPQSRMLLAIKQGGLGKFKDLEASAIAQGKTLRGMYLRMKRGADGQSANTGEPSMIPELGGVLFDIVPEAEIIATYGHPAIMGRDGHTVIKSPNADITAIDYERVFPMPDVNELRKRFGIPPQAGSSQQVEQYLEGQAGAEGAQAPGVPRRALRGGTNPQQQHQAPVQPAPGGTRTRVRGVPAAQPVAQPAAEDHIPMGGESDPFGGEQ